MRIGFVCPYDLGRYGGVQNQIQLLATAMASRGHETVLVGPGATGPRDAVLVGSVIDIPGNGSMTPIALSPRAIGRTAEAVGDVDVVHLHEPLMPMVSLGALLKTQRPMVGTFHADPTRFVRGLYRVGAPVLRRLLRRLDEVIAVSPVAAEAISGLAEVTIIPNALELRSPPVVLRNDRRVAFLGRDDPRKGLKVLLDAWPSVVARVPDAELIVIGSDQVRNAPAGVVFHGRVSDDRKRDLLAASGVFCAPNTGGESFGVVIVEGMAAGAAVVASALPGFEYVLDGAGVTVPPGSSPALAAALVDVLSDDAIRGELQESGLVRARAFDIERLAGEYEAVYQDVAQR